MKLRDAFKDHYLLESTRRNELTTSLLIPIAILTVVLGALAVIAKELHSPLDTISIIQLALVTLAALASVLCVYFLFRSLYGLAYGFVPTTVELANYRKDLEDYFIACGVTPSKATVKADDETLTYLFGEYAKNAHRNSINNDIKSGFIHNSNSALVAAVLLTGTLGMVYAFASVISPQQVNKVEITKLPPITTMPPPAVSAASAPPPPPPPPRPQPPPSKVVREHRTPPPPPRPPSR